MDTVTIVNPGPGARIVPALDAIIPAGVPVAAPADVADSLIEQGWTTTDADPVTAEELAAMAPRRNAEGIIDEVHYFADADQFIDLDEVRRIEGLVGTSTADGTVDDNTDAGDGSTEE